MLAVLTQVETVALWAGLIVGIASVVLAVVAIYFSIEVDRRSSETATSTVGALERIQGAVEGQSRDTRDLIKVGWERMLGSVEPADQQEPGSAEGAREIAAGLAAEIRAALTQGDGEGGSIEPSPTSAETDDRVDEFRETLETQLRAASSRPGDEIQFWIDQITSLSEDAQALLRALPSHITADQLRALRRDPEGIRDELHELRRAGFLVPLEGYNHERKRTVVYWLPPPSARPIRAALLMLPEPRTELTDFVEAKLAEIGYPDIPS
jgi:hypothetical protein